MSRDKGAAIIEAAIAIPMVLLLTFGLVEFGRFVITGSTVANASREAARFATASGDGPSAVPSYADCDGIRGAARQYGVVGRPSDAQITLEYDSGPGTAVFETCGGQTVAPDLITDSDRIVVTVSVPFRTAVPLINEFIEPTTISSRTTRTISKEN